MLTETARAVSPAGGERMTAGRSSARALWMTTTSSPLASNGCRQISKTSGLKPEVELGGRSSDPRRITDHPSDQEAIARGSASAGPRSGFSGSGAAHLRIGWRLSGFPVRPAVQTRSAHGESMAIGETRSSAEAARFAAAQRFPFISPPGVTAIFVRLLGGLRRDKDGRLPRTKQIRYLHDVTVFYVKLHRH